MASGGKIFIEISRILSMDPTLVQAGATVVLVGITAIYVILLWKSNRDIWKREEKRIISMKIGLRKLISEEISINDMLIDDILDEIKKFNVPNNELRAIKIPEETAYKDAIGDLVILGEEEMGMIMYIYHLFKDIGDEYIKIKELSKIKFTGSASTSTKNSLIDKLKSDINEVSRLYDGLDKLYQKLFEKKIKEEELEEKIKDLY